MRALMKNEYGTLGNARNFLAGSRRKLIFAKAPQKLRRLGVPELFVFARISAGNASNT